MSFYCCIEILSILLDLEPVYCCDFIQIIDSRGAFLTQIGSGHLYILVALIAEVVQTFILADFCYYYVKRYDRFPFLIQNICYDVHVFFVSSMITKV